MLLINDSKSEVAENNIVFYQCMCTDYYSCLAGRQIFENRTALGSLRRTCKYGNIDPGPLEILAHVLIVLACKHFGRSHDT